MTPEEHYAEAERLLGLTQQGILQGAPIGFSTHVEVAQLAQVHATLALYRPPARRVNPFRDPPGRSATKWEQWR